MCHFFLNKLQMDINKPPCYEVVPVTNDRATAVVAYLRNNYFQDDPVARVVGQSKINDTVEKVILQKIEEGDGVLAVSTCADRHILGVAIGCPFGPIETDLTYRLAKVTEDKNLKNYMEYLSHMKYLHDISTSLATQKIWDICILSTDRGSRGMDIGKMLTKNILVLGKDHGFTYGRLDCINSLSTTIARCLQLRMMWWLEFKDFSNYYHDAMYGVLCPHSGLSVFITDLKSKKIKRFEREIFEFEGQKQLLKVRPPQK